MQHRPHVLATLDAKLSPAHTALVIIDMVNDFAHPDGLAVRQGGRDLSHIDAAIPQMHELLVAARAAGVRVVHVQHTTLAGHASDSGPWLDARSRATYSGRDICLDGTWGHQVIDALHPIDGETCVAKHRYSAFAGTGLDLILRSAQVATVITCGSSTNVCVESTARAAFDHDYYVVWPRDASGSWSPRLHEATLESAAQRYATVCTTAEVIEVWQGHSAQ